MKVTYIYVVFGSSGQYEEHDEWPVIAYFSQRSAKKHAKDAAATAHAIYVKWGDRDRERVNANLESDDDWKGPPNRRNQFDPTHEENAGGWSDTSYFASRVKVSDAVSI